MPMNSVGNAIYRKQALIQINQIIFNKLEPDVLMSLYL